MKPLAAAIAVATPLLLAACGSDGESGQDSSQSGPTVTATTGILAEIADQVAGPDAQVEQLIPDSASPHDFALSAKDRAELEDSALLVHNGAGLEAGVPVDQVSAPKWALADHAGELLAFGEEDEHTEEDGGHAEGEEGPEEAEEHAHSGADPHVWMDPSRVAAALPSLSDALAEADPEHAGGYRRRARAYAEELRALDAEIAETVAVVPPARRELISSHDALGYFADRYGFEVVATAFPASGPESEASAQAIAEVEAAIEQSGAPAVFAEETDDPQALEQIAERTGVAIVTGLLVESPASAGSYAEMLRTDAVLISEALGDAGAG